MLLSGNLVALASRRLLKWLDSASFGERPHTTDLPQMVVNCKGNPIMSGKSRLVKYYHLARIIVWELFFWGVFLSGKSRLVKGLMI